MAVLLKENREIVGSSGFARPHDTTEIELGYLLAQKFRGMGLATEAPSACLKYGFENLNFREVMAMTDLENVASQKVLEKIGFAQRGMEPFNGEETLVYLAKKPVNI
jgi:ribosomal-protein-alanine N-acetyltransferase